LGLNQSIGTPLSTVSALALSVPALLPQPDEIIAIVFGAVLFTLVGQRLTT